MRWQEKNILHILRGTEWAGIGQCPSPVNLQ
jgi:hypothetical protein